MGSKINSSPPVALASVHSQAVVLLFLIHCLLLHLFFKKLMDGKKSRMIYDIARPSSNGYVYIFLIVNFEIKTFGQHSKKLGLAIFEKKYWLSALIETPPAEDPFFYHYVQVRIPLMHLFLFHHYIV